jgi:lysophospholipase L1-like esterase
MILFLGDSFTWGQGLEWEHLIQNENWKVEDINKIIPPKYACERLPIHLQDFREKNRWPRLVSEHFNHQYDLSRCGNGGSNNDAWIFLENIENFIHLENLDLIIFQFTNCHRNINNISNGDIEDIFNSDVNAFEYHMNIIKSKNKNVKFLTLSWLPETADRLESQLGSRYLIKFNHNGVIYNSFEKFLDEMTLYSKYKGLLDYHFNLEGHQFIAKSVIEHIEKYDIFNNYKVI